MSVSSPADRPPRARRESPRWAAARAGAGAVTMLSPANALAVNAAHLTSVILRKAESKEEVLEYLRERKPQALVFGPGLGPREKVGRFALDLLAALDGAPKSFVIDADGLTSLAKQGDALFEAARRHAAPDIVLTPHEGEFARLFPPRRRRIRFCPSWKRRGALLSRATARSSLKGPDTVIASPDGRAAINSTARRCSPRQAPVTCCPASWPSLAAARHANLRGGMRGGVDARRGSSKIRTGPDRGGFAAGAAARAARTVCVGK
jgi:hypothetical protein